MDELFYTINFNRAEGGKETVNIPALRDKIEKEIWKGENKNFRCRGITRNYHT